MHSVIMLDELHRLPKREQENLLPVLNEGTIQMDNGVGRTSYKDTLELVTKATMIKDYWEF